MQSARSQNLARLDASIAARQLTVRGIVQGVGFRPYVYRLATRLGLCGSVRNRPGGVVVELEGEPDSIDRFVAELIASPPARARIEAIDGVAIPPRGLRTFAVGASEHSPDGAIAFSPDLATCDRCLAELFSPGDRRYRYPFLNCANCGPRLSIVTESPYDRERTTMAAFAMCPGCGAEYGDPSDRRFHAEATACAQCGPRLRLFDAGGRVIVANDPIADTVEALRRGRIAALKGLGGYHLACDARIEAVVAELRRRKRRPDKPFAIMAADLRTVRALCEVSPAEAAILTSPKRPIVLLRRRVGAALADSVAPGNPLVGVMLPYTPLHALILRDLRFPLVMTSGNRIEEPIAYREDDALERLSGVADFFVTHDRAIHLRSDDSIVRVLAGEPTVLRRSRGYVPEPIRLPRRCSRPTLALGGQLKATFALGYGLDALVSHHLGDLDDYRSYRDYLDAIVHYERLFPIRPELLVSDLHPDYLSTRYAQERAKSEHLEIVAVQHHHAHLASCLAENGITHPVIGVVFDGTGFGSDGAIWGGEFLIGDLREFRRAAHLRYVAMPGGERAIREPWRMAAAHLADAGEDSVLLAHRIPARDLRVVEQMINARLNSPMTSSVGRLFDAVASIAAVRDRVSYEAQAAIELEWLAQDAAPERGYRFDLDGSGAALVIDTRPVILAAAEDARNRVEPRRIARRFHSTIVEMVVQVCAELRRREGLNDVALSGGVFMNEILAHEVTETLSARGFRLHRHRIIPPNDGGLSLGQLAIAAARTE